MVHLDDFDIPVLAKHGGGALNQFGQYGNTERSVGCPQYRNLRRGLFDTSGSEVVEPGRSNQNWDAGGYRAVEARLERGGGGEIDDDVAMILVDGKTAIILGGLRDGAAHPAVGRDQGQADRLVSTAHGATLSEAFPTRRAPPPGRGPWPH